MEPAELGRLPWAEPGRDEERDDASRTSSSSHSRWPADSGGPAPSAPPRNSSSTAGASFGSCGLRRKAASLKSSSTSHSTCCHFSHNWSSGWSSGAHASRSAFSR